MSNLPDMGAHRQVERLYCLMREFRRDFPGSTAHLTTISTLGTELMAVGSGVSAVGLPIEDDDEASDGERHCEELIDFLREEAWMLDGASNWPRCRAGHTHPMELDHPGFRWECPVDPTYTKAITPDPNRPGTL